MIIRRVRRSNYAVINNDPMDDLSLTAEALGVLVYLLSRPHDWRVIPNQLAKRFGCGRNRVYRIIKDLIETCYIVRSDLPKRGKSGTWTQYQYDVHDERQHATEGAPCTQNRDTAPCTQKPYTEKPYTENRDTLLRTDSLLNTDTHQARDLAGYFEEFWKEAYPKRMGRNPRSPAEAKFKAAVKSGADPRDIIRGARGYAAELKRTGKLGTQYVAMAQTWLNQKSWTEYQPRDAGSLTNAARVFVKQDSEEFRAWNEHLLKTTGQGAPVSPNDGGWWFASALPPVAQKSMEAA